MIVDTDVFIWYFRGNLKAEHMLSKMESIEVSAVTLMELIQGVKNKQELRIINQFFHTNSIHVYYLNEEINLRAIYLLEAYGLSHGTEWGDALIAATALYYGKTILTGNIKHYTCLPNVDVKKFIPT